MGERSTPSWPPSATGVSPVRRMGDTLVAPSRTIVQFKPGVSPVRRMGDTLVAPAAWEPPRQNKFWPRREETALRAHQRLAEAVSWEEEERAAHNRLAGAQRWVAGCSSAGNRNSVSRMRGFDAVDSRAPTRRKLPIRRATTSNLPSSEQSRRWIDESASPISGPRKPTSGPAAPNRSPSVCLASRGHANVYWPNDIASRRKLEKGIHRPNLRAS